MPRQLGARRWHRRACRPGIRSQRLRCLPSFRGVTLRSARVRHSERFAGSTSTAHILAFNLSGTDPFTGAAIPTASTESVGAAPIIFITSRSGALKSVKNATDSQLQTVFGGTTCNASAFGAGILGQHPGFSARTSFRDDEHD